MRVSAKILCVCLLLGAAARAADLPPPIRSFAPSTIETLGRGMADQYRAASEALTVLHAQYPSQAPRGWITDGTNVRFILDGAAGPEIWCDVSAGAKICMEPKDRALGTTERAQYDARNLALASETRHCSDRIDTVALKDPEGDGWLVWTLAVSNDPQAVVMGGYTRFSISRDGRTLKRTDPLSTSCQTAPHPPPQGRSFLIAQVVSMLPVESQVYLNLSRSFPIDVGTMDGRYWKVDQGHIQPIDADMAGDDGHAARALAGLEENCRIAMTKMVDGARKYFIGGSAKVIAMTEQEDKFALPTPPSDAAIDSLSCLRNDIIPMPNDYKVLAAGYVLSILDVGADHPKRVLELELKDGKVVAHIADGDRLGADQQAKVDARVAQFQAKIAAAH